MSIRLKINNFKGDNYYIGWTPLPCEISQVPGTVSSVTLTNKYTGTGGQLVFRLNKDDEPNDEITINVPADGSPAVFFIAGKYKFASIQDKDAIMVVSELGSGNVLFEQPLMVRVRKNANELTDGERDRFLNALLDFNQNGQYELFCDIHNDDGYDEAHRRFGFLPWHRVFILDLERQLQIKYPDVTIPYWRFDQPAPRVFTPDFMGEPDRSNGRLKFATSNPLSQWAIKGIRGLVRLRSYASSAPSLKTEAETLALSNIYSFVSGVGIESNPHNNAHGNFERGPICDPTTAPQDPMFFMLHCNVDRLWALWQAVNKNYDISKPGTYPYVGSGSRSSSPFVGDYTEDSLWPWNKDTVRPRPSVMRGNGMPQPAHYPTGSWPESTPLLKQVIDYQGIITGKPNYFDYDEVYYQSLNAVL